MQQQQSFCMWDYTIDGRNSVEQWAAPQNEQRWKSLLFSISRLLLFAMFGCRIICCKSHWVKMCSPPFKCSVILFKLYTMSSKYRLMLLIVICLILIRTDTSQVIWYIYPLKWSATHSPGHLKIRELNRKVERKKFWELQSGITYSGSDGLGCARLLKAKLEAIFPRVVGCNRDGGGRGSNTICSGHLWGQLKQVVIKPLSQRRITHEL